MGERKKEIEEVEEVMDVVLGKIPKIINDVMEAIYSKEAGARIGKGVAALYNELIEGGIEKEQALEMAKDYLNSFKEISSKMNLDQNNNKS